MRFLPKIQKPVSTTRHVLPSAIGGLVDLPDVAVGGLDVESGEVGRRGHEHFRAERVDSHHGSLHEKWDA